MDVVFAIGLLAALAVLAVRYGVDSREPHRSKEEQFARVGLTWGYAEEPSVGRRQISRRTGRVGWVRARLAAGITWVANWLDPNAIASAS